jgi:hypothetical protein
MELQKTSHYREKKPRPRVASGPGKPYGTLITVFTIVTGPIKTSALPLSVVIALTPAVEIETPA